MLWVLGLALSLCGLFIWLEFGTMYPRSGGEKVYLEAVYRRPKHLATLIFAAYAIFLNFSSASCLVSHVSVYGSFLTYVLYQVFAQKCAFICLFSPHTRLRSNKYRHSQWT